MDAPDAEVGDPHPRWKLLHDQAPGHFDAEAVVAQEDVADAGDQRMEELGRYIRSIFR
jgi:hypothetical protein